MFKLFVWLSITKVNRIRPLDKPFPGVLINIKNNNSNNNVTYV